MRSFAGSWLDDLDFAASLFHYFRGDRETHRPIFVGAIIDKR
jgi:hypothetical protein